MSKYIKPDDLRQILIDNDIDHIQTNDLKEVIQIVDELPTITEQEIVKPILDEIRGEIVKYQKEYHEYGWVYDDTLDIIDKYRAESEG